MVASALPVSSPSSADLTRRTRPPSIEMRFKSLRLTLTNKVLPSTPSTTCRACEDEAANKQKRLRSSDFFKRSGSILTFSHTGQQHTAAALAKLKYVGFVHL